MADRHIRECDIPGCHDSDAKRFEIRRDDIARWIIDLCPKHAQPLLDIAEHGQEHDLQLGPVDPRIKQNFTPLVVLDPDD